MSDTKRSGLPRTACAACGKDVAYNPTTRRISGHNRTDGQQCWASGHTTDEVQARLVPREDVEMLREAWRIGDAWAVARYFEIDCPAFTPAGDVADCLECELAAMIKSHQDWIVHTIKRRLGPIR